MTLTSDSPASITASRALSLVLGQGGGGGGEASITGTIAHGSIVTLNDPQNRLGTRTNQLFRHWQQGSEIVLNGTASTAEEGASVPDTAEVWGSYYPGGTTIVTDNLRHPRIDQQYRGLGKGACINAKAFDNIGPEDKYYFAKWVYAGSRIARSYTIAYESITGGPFETNALRSRGEPVTVTFAGGGIGNGWVTMVSNGWISLDIFSPGMSAFQGATVTGDNSGAVATLPDVLDSSNFGGTASTKISRNYSSLAYQSNQSIIVTTAHNGVIIVDNWDINGDYAGRLANYYTDSANNYSFFPEEWHLYELELDFSGETGAVRQRVDNGAIEEITGLDKTNLSQVKGFYLSNVGLDQSGSPAPDADTGLREDWGEIVADNELKRLVIGDAPVLSDCAHIEIQNHTSWAAGEVSFKVNQGAFDYLSGKYLFAVGSGFAELLQVAL